LTHSNTFSVGLKSGKELKNFKVLREEVSLEDSKSEIKEEKSDSEYNPPHDISVNDEEVCRSLKNKNSVSTLKYSKNLESPKVYSSPEPVRRTKFSENVGREINISSEPKQKQNHPFFGKKQKT